MQIAILDDYQNAALASADWSAVQARARITVFYDHVEDPGQLATRLAPFDAVCVMRERTRLDDDLFARLPRLRLIASNAPHNSAIDLDAAKRREAFRRMVGMSPRRWRREHSRTLGSRAKNRS